MVKFYDLKTRTHVEVPESEVTKTVSKRTTKAGKELDRYMVHASHEGRKLTKIVSKAVYDAMPEAAHLSQ